MEEGQPQSPRLPNDIRAAALSQHKIPWDDPDFSERMLREHLSQSHDGASRRFEIIDAQVKWIEARLPGPSSRVLDLGCGPGFYAERLAAAGHRCKGIDFSPASIRYAIESSAAVGIEYVYGDVRAVEFGGPFDFVMMLSGELNMFDREDARLIVSKARKALAEGGLLLLEVHPMEAVRRRGERGGRRYATAAGPFSDRAHSVVQEHQWDAENLTAHTAYFAIDAATSEVTAYGETAYGYSGYELLEMVRQAGFSDAEVDSTFPPGRTDDLLALVARAEREA
jgi:SAM-dependent methyltransferase